MRYLLILLSLILSLSVKAQDKIMAVEYMKNIDTSYTLLSFDIWEYMRAVPHSRKAGKIERKREVLISTSNNALKAIKEIGDYKGSLAYRDSVISFLSISYNVLKDDYGRLVVLEGHAGDSYQEMEDYMTAKDFAFVKIKEEIEKTPETDVTQEMIDKYNAAGTALNQSVGDFNENNQALNNRRNELINKWNKVSGAFTDRNVPK